ncbi:MAG: hypothetical protein IJW46_02695 [Clostridia bacterium]|nr:hypothetical protein [Clostridia bacterium]
MNFEELYEKYINKTATEEEVKYVEEEIAKAKKLSLILEEADTKRAIAPAEKETVRRSVAAFLKKTKLRIAAIVLAAVVLLGALSVGGFFAAAAIKASANSVYDRDEAVALCQKWMTEAYENIHAGELRVSEVERDLALLHGFSRAYYEYDIEIEYKGTEYEFWVDAASGEVRLVDRD